SNGRVHQIVQRCSAVSFEQVQDLLGLAALAGTLGLRRRDLLGRLGGLVGRGGLLPRLGFAGATWGFRGATFAVALKQKERSVGPGCESLARRAEGRR